MSSWYAVMPPLGCESMAPAWHRHRTQLYPLNDAAALFFYRHWLDQFCDSSARHSSPSLPQPVQHFHLMFLVPARNQDQELQELHSLSNRLFSRVRAGVAAVTFVESQVPDSSALGLRGATRHRGGGKWQVARIAAENCVETDSEIRR
jgi:hypothetical protein